MAVAFSRHVLVPSESSSVWFWPMLFDAIALLSLLSVQGAADGLDMTRQGVLKVIKGKVLPPPVSAASAATTPRTTTPLIPGPARSDHSGDILGRAGRLRVRV
jgi:hypothetical protein